MSQNYKVCSLDEIPVNRTKIFDVEGTNIQLTRIDDKVYAFEDMCSHEELSIGERIVFGGEIQCPRHGAKFEVATGKATGLPAVMPLKTFEVTIEDNDVFIAK